MKTVTVVAGQTIELGYQYDNYATEVVFPSDIVTPFITNFGSSGIFAIWYRRSGDSLGYPIGSPLVTFDSSNNTITWQVVEADTANPGTAQVQLRYIIDEVCVMSQMFTGVVSDSVDVGTTVPEPMEQWADAILNATQAGSLMEEVEDIRLGYDGTEYPSAGDAVRNQIVQAMENGGGLSDEVKDALLQIAQKVAYIDEDGQTYYDDLYDALYPPATGVTLSATAWGSNTIGETYQLRATVAPSGWSGTVVWSSSNTSVATVSQTGLVTVVGYGLCIISATADSVSAPCRVSVSQLSVKSISAVFNQGNNKIYNTDDFETEIKKYLTVTATMSDDSTQVLPSSAYGVNTTYLDGASTGSAQATYNQKTSEWFSFNVTEWLTSITATYTQSGTVYDTDSLDSLKSDLVVTATYEDGTSATVSDYTLSGTLAEGTSTITVSYGGKTTTFNVTVTVEPGVSDGVYSPNNVVRGKYIDDSGNVLDATDYSGYIEDYIPLEENAVYALTYTNAPSNTRKINWRISEYDSNKTFIAQTHIIYTENDTRTTVFVPVNSSVKYIRLAWYNDESTTFVATFSFYKCTELPMEIGGIDTSGNNVTNNARIRSDYIEAENTLAVSGCPWDSTWGTSGGYAFRCYDVNKTFLGSITNNGDVYRVDISNVNLPTGTKYVRLFANRYTGYTFSAGWESIVINPIVINGTHYKMVEA